MFLTEGEWSRAYDVAETALTIAIQRGDIVVPEGHWTKSVRSIAIDVAGAVIRSSELHVDGDIDEDVYIESDIPVARTA